MLCCLHCSKQFRNDKEYEKHISICIFYLYNNKYKNKLNNELIKEILCMINIFDLHNKNIEYKVYKERLLNNLQNECIIISSFKIIGHDSNAEQKKIEYLYNYINNSNKETYNYIDIVNIISELNHVSNNDLLNLINAYKISYKNCNS